MNATTQFPRIDEDVDRTLSINKGRDSATDAMDAYLLNAQGAATWGGTWTGNKSDTALAVAHMGGCAPIHAAEVMAEALLSLAGASYPAPLANNALSSHAECLIRECETALKVVAELHGGAVDAAVDVSIDAANLPPKTDALTKALHDKLNGLDGCIARLVDAQTRLFLVLRHPMPACTPFSTTQGVQA